MPKTGTCMFYNIRASIESFPCSSKYDTVPTRPQGHVNKNEACFLAEGARFISNCTALAGHPMQAQEHWRVPFHNDVTLWFCLLVTQEEMSSCLTRKYVFLWHKKTCLLVTQVIISSCVARGHSSCVSRRHFFLCHKKTLLLVSEEDISFVSQEDNSSCVTRRHNFIKKKEAGPSSCEHRRVPVHDDCSAWLIVNQHGGS